MTSAGSGLQTNIQSAVGAASGEKGAFHAMKIWYQSAVSLDAAQPYQRLVESRLEKIAPGVTVDIHGTPSAAHVSRDAKDHIGYVYVQSLNKEVFINGALRAEAEGYDAFFVGTLPDIGYEDIRTLVDIPVVAYGQASLMMGAMLGSCVGIVNFVHEIDPLLVRNARNYGLSSVLGPMVTLDSALDGVVGAYEHPGPLIEAFEIAARTAIAQGADVIIPGPGPLNALLAANGVERVDGAPLIDSIAVGIKLCILRAELFQLNGTHVSRRGYYNERPRQELVAHLREMYQKTIDVV